MEVYGQNGEVVTDIGKVLDKWKTDYEKLFNTTKVTGDKFYDGKLKEIEEFEKKLDQEGDTSWCNVKISKVEIKRVATNAKKGKAVGGDLLPYEVFQNPESVDLLEQLFNRVFTTNLVPTMWLKFLIKPIPKGGDADPRIPLEYRGISLLSTVGKLYSSILNERITTHLDNLGILVDEQNGFRRKRSCEEHIFALSSILKNRKVKSQSTFVAFIDFAKAFDTVDRNLLMYKIHEAGIKGNIYRTIKALYSGNQCAILLKNFVTPWFDSTIGIRQGDSLSPTLFAIFINDLAVVIKEKFKGVRVNENTTCPILLYADDIVLLAESAVNLKAMLKEVENWCNKWRITVNTKKTKVIHFRPLNKKITTATFVYGRTKLEVVSTYKYLGVIFDEFMEFNVGVKTLAGAGGRGLGKIFSSHRRLHGIGFKTYTHLFETMVDPIVLYSAGVWGTKRFTFTDAIQNRAQRMFLGVHRYACNEAINAEMGWRSMFTKQILCVLRLWNRLCQMDENRLCKQIFNEDHKRCKRNWCADVKKFLEMATGDNLHYDNKLTVNVKECGIILDELDKINWEVNIEKKPKLRTFRIFKKTYQTENYVKRYLSKSSRAILAQFRCGISPLKIEIGRFYNIPLELRLCELCSPDSIEDEKHFLLECPEYSDERELLYNAADEINPHFNALESDKKLEFLMQNEGITSPVVNYLHKAFEKRRNATTIHPWRD